MNESVTPRNTENAEERARSILERFRWPPNGRPVCPDCGSQWPIYKQTRKGVTGYYRCPSLHPHPSGSPKPLVFTVRTGTILARSHFPLEKWLYCLAWYGRLSSLETIPSASWLAKVIGVNRKTASAVLKHLYDLRFGEDSDDQANEFLLSLMAAQIQARTLPS